MTDPDAVRFTPATMSHATMVAHWRAGEAVPAAPRTVDYARYDGVWWERSGGGWAELPDCPLSLGLTARRAELVADGRDEEHDDGGRDPWTVARNRLRTGLSCPQRGR